MRSAMNYIVCSRAPRVVLLATDGTGGFGILPVIQERGTESVRLLYRSIGGLGRYQSIFPPFAYSVVRRNE